MLWTLFTALRPKADTDKYGYFSFGGAFNFDNFFTAWNQGGAAKYFLNSVIITVPTVLLTLFFASMMAFAVSRFTWKFNVTLLIMFTAGNLLPPQVLAAPLFEMFKHTPLPLSVSDSGYLLNTYYAVIAVDTAFQIGFCTFVLSNYMKALPDRPDRGRPGGRRRRLAAVLEHHHAAVPAGAGRAGHPGGHLDLQRLLLAAAVHPERRPAPDHHRDQQPAGPVPLRTTT